MKNSHLPLMLLWWAFILILSMDLSGAQACHFFYFVQQWPGSVCDTRQSCCYPTPGKPSANFGVHGLWPNYNDGVYPSNCDPHSPLDLSKISDLLGRMQSEWPMLACPSSSGRQFWQHEWEKHGTCSESVLDQRRYFLTALDLKREVNLLGTLQAAGIQPDGGFYRFSSISNAIKAATGHTSGIQCNIGEDKNSQLYQVYLCLDSSANSFIDCPILPRSSCNSDRVAFLAF
ncbi:unnamed protein product [Spirodela intermedia]|uniref:Uncharacterized protein n=1 Tax=Spirodela intermedia TaxID=51605 RepID=A0A7I8KG77_SPIIN|nr:unnamed protein product [Spirodela intermedia]